MITFQEVILRLQEYWNKQGCALLQPIDIEVGAGTSHTATFLRALGPEPWRAAYVQPSRRPKDARYGENPNRLHQHHQYQVVLKPSPVNIVDLYLGSLRALGIDTSVNDIRFGRRRSPSFGWCNCEGIREGRKSGGSCRSGTSRVSSFCEGSVKHGKEENNA